MLAPIGGVVLLVAVLGMLGCYYAATDGVLMAFGSAVVPEDVRGRGLALLGAVASLARLFGAELRVLHAVEPLPAFAEMPMAGDDAAFYADSREQFERCLEPLLEEGPAQAVRGRGHAGGRAARHARGG